MINTQNHCFSREQANLIFEKAQAVFHKRLLRVEAELMEAKTSLSKLDVSIKVFEKKHAFLMTQNARWGSQSVWHGLPEDVVQIIFDRVDEI
jgi:hypothetical protein